MVSAALMAPNVPKAVLWGRVLTFGASSWEGKSPRLSYKAFGAQDRHKLEKQLQALLLIEVFGTGQALLLTHGCGAGQYARAC